MQKPPEPVYLDVRGDESITSWEHFLIKNPDRKWWQVWKPRIVVVTVSDELTALGVDNA